MVLNQSKECDLYTYDPYKERLKCAWYERKPIESINFSLDIFLFETRLGFGNTGAEAFGGMRNLCSPNR